MKEISKGEYETLVENKESHSVLITKDGIFQEVIE